MKIKNDFVTNSSSTSFIITNLSNEDKTLVDFVVENPQLIEQFRDQYYKDEEYNQKNLIKSAEENNIKFSKNSSTECIFGDEHGTLIDRVFDYILRDGGKSKNFKWRLFQYLR